MFNLTDIVKNLIIINVLVFVITHVMPMVSLEFLSVYYPVEGGNFSPYQLVTHIFAHGSFSHILFNMIGLIVFGPLVEQKLGMKRFFILYFGAGLMSFLLSFIVHKFQYPPELFRQVHSLGASGAIMGVAVAYAMNFPNNRIHLLFPPVALKAAHLVLIYVAMDLINGFGNSSSGVGHFGHLGGALFGFLITLYWDRGRNSFRK